MEYIGVFFTHSGAIKYHRYLSSKGIENETMPVPRKLSSNCGIGVRFITEEDINNMITEDIEKVFSLENGCYEVVYDGE